MVGELRERTLENMKQRLTTPVSPALSVFSHVRAAVRGLTAVSTQQYTTSTSRVRAVQLIRHACACVLSGANIQSRHHLASSNSVEVGGSTILPRHACAPFTHSIHARMRSIHARTHALYSRTHACALFTHACARYQDATIIYRAIKD